MSDKDFVRMIESAMSGLSYNVSSLGVPTNTPVSPTALDSSHLLAVDKNSDRYEHYGLGDWDLFSEIC